MIRTKEEYENLINNSPLFELNKEKDIALYKRERYALLCIITEYYSRFVYKGRKLEDFSYTLMETSAECIKYYRKGKGEFINLLNHNMKRNLVIAKAKEAAQQYRQGIAIGVKNEKKIRAIIAYATSKSLDVYNSAVQKKIAEMTGMSVEEVSKLIEMNDNATAQTSTVTNDDGDELELFDLKQDLSVSPESKVINSDALRERLDDIEQAFKSVQDRQKRLLSMLLTAKILEEFGKVDFLMECVFYSETVLQMYGQSGQVPTAREIAESCGVSEQSASRTFKNFIAKIKR